ncbi:hypothetical protein [Staphylococcus hyicus]|uniref:hypothetical protein n=1 Tax=Staphylococcus hyicus TaxID=1284 RepID=UPI00236624B1|nr:hypothetical protein [Staphylococcus hyicus]
MDAEIKSFLETLSYAHCYVHINTSVLTGYKDEALTKEIRLHQHESYAQVLYEHDANTLALRIQEQRIFVPKSAVSLMLYDVYDFKLNQYTIIKHEKPSLRYDSKDKATVPIHIECYWKQIAKHLYITQQLHNHNHQLAVKKLLGDNIKKRNHVKQLIEMKDTLLNRYLKLRESRLGRIQIKLWERRS